MRSVLVGMIGLSLVASALAGEVPAPKFTKKPAVAKKGDGAVISFAVDRDTDVAVFVEDGQESDPALGGRCARQQRARPPQGRES
jgi:hypothetical protein